MRQPDNARPLVIVAAAALVRDDGRLLLAQRPEGKSMAGLWELPGGKLEPGESPQTALVRELREELEIGVDPADLQAFTFAAHGYEKFELLMPVFLCRKWTGEPDGQEGQSLAWVAPGEAKSYPVPDADIPLIEYFVQWSKGMRQ